jgi:MerR family transcriptional regulator, redox-sensitive transcriptional activator SoxR
MLTIGDVAARSGRRVSAIRYYEQMGLLPQAARQSGKRVYDASIFDRLSIIDLAKAAGFGLGDIRTLIAAVDSGTPQVWAAAGRRKRADIDRQMARLRIAKMLLAKLDRCGCATLADCGRNFARAAAGYRAAR